MRTRHCAGVTYTRAMATDHQWEHPTTREVRAMLGDDLARWWLDQYPGAMTVARARWVRTAARIMSPGGGTRGTPKEQE